MEWGGHVVEWGGGFKSYTNSEAIWKMDGKWQIKGPREPGEKKSSLLLLLKRNGHLQ